MSISTIRRWSNTNLSKSEKFEHFCVDSLTHPTTSIATFDSKHRFLFFFECGRVLLNYNIRTFAASIMKIGYGIAVQESDDPYISIVEEVMDGTAQAGIPGSFWVDLFPILRYVPSWFPGAGFQKKAARWREAINTMAEKPFHHVQEQLVYYTFPFLVKSLWASFLNNDSSENWQSYPVRSSNPHWMSSWRRRFSTVQFCEKCGFYSLLRYVVYITNLGHPAD